MSALQRVTAIAARVSGVVFVILFFLLFVFSPMSAMGHDDGPSIKCVGNQF